MLQRLLFASTLRNEKRAKTDQARLQSLEDSLYRRGASTKPSCDACEKQQDPKVLPRSEGIEEKGALGN